MLPLDQKIKNDAMKPKTPILIEKNVPTKNIIARNIIEINSIFIKNPPRFLS